MTITALDMRIAARVKDYDFKAWKHKVEATGGCTQPIHLSGEYAIHDITSGAKLSGVSGRVFVPCGTRRASLCQACADRYAADAFHLIRSGLTGGKDVPASVAEKPRLFVTLTAPSFGTVHSRKITNSGKVIPCRCTQRHHADDPRVGTAIDRDAYDYTGAVLWQAHASELWHRFTIRLRRELAHAAGLTVREFPQHARISYAKVAEYQKRGLIHFHAVIRLDGPTGPHTPTPAWAHPDLLSDAVETAATTTRMTRSVPVGDSVSQSRTFMWGEQVDIRTIAPAAAERLENTDGVITDHALAGYIAKYATKGTNATDTADRPLRTEDDIDTIHTTEHHRTMMRTAWHLGALDGLQHLRAWAHMLGFRGHFLTKSIAYSTRFETLRNARRLYRYTETLHRLGVTEDTITVINHWKHTATGHRNDAERELAHGIYQRQKNEKTQHPKENTS